MTAFAKDFTVVMVGAGNLAIHLGRALFHCGFRIVQVYSRTEVSARTLAEEIEAGYTTDLNRLVSDAGLYIVALTDEALVEQASRLTLGRENSFWVHTAGCVGMDIWKGKALRYGVLYPMQTFSKQWRMDFAEIPLFVEASSDADVALLRRIASMLSHRVHEADSKQRKVLHLAAVMACNFTNHLYTLAAEVLESSGLPFGTLLPLIDETVAKVHRLPPRTAQTGPAIRGDRNVMQTHLEMLAGRPDLQEIYSILSRSIGKKTPGLE